MEWIEINSKLRIPAKPIKYLQSPERGKYGKIIWTDEMIDFLKSNFYSMTNRELANALGLNITKVREKCYELGMKRMEMEYWTREQIDFLQAYYPIMGDVEMAELFNQMYPKEKGWTKKHIEKKRRYLKLKRTKEQIAEIKQRNVHQGRFSINHWKRWKGQGREQGELAVWKYHTGTPVVVIKWSGGRFFGIYDTWAHINWMLHYGPIPEGMNIIHKDGDTLNCDISNLQMLSNADNSRRNAAKSIHELSDNYIKGLLAPKAPELKELIPPELIELKRQQILLKRAIKS